MLGGRGYGGDVFGSRRLNFGRRVGFVGNYIRGAWKCRWELEGLDNIVRTVVDWVAVGDDSGNGNNEGKVIEQKFTSGDSVGCREEVVVTARVVRDED